MRQSVSNEYHSAFHGYAAFGATLTLFSSIHVFTNTAPEFLVSYLADCGQDKDLRTNMCTVTEHSADVAAVTVLMYAVVFPVVTAMSLLLQQCLCSPCKRSVNDSSMNDPLSGAADDNAQERAKLLKDELSLKGAVNKELNSGGQKPGYTQVGDDEESALPSKNQQALKKVQARLAVIGRVSTLLNSDLERQAFVVPPKSVAATVCDKFKNVASTFVGMFRLENPLHAGAAITVVSACLLSKDIQNKFGLESGGGLALVDTCIGLAAIASLIATRKVFVRPPLRFMTGCLSEKAASWIVQSRREEESGIREDQGGAYLPSDVNLDEDEQSSKSSRFCC